MYLFSASQGHGTSAWPGASGMPTECRHGTNSPVVAEDLERAVAHPRHDPHRDGHVGRVGELDADVRDRAAERAHRERDDVHGPAPHAAPEQVLQGGPHLGGVPPVVGRPCVDLLERADVGAVLDAGHVAGVRARPVAGGALGLREPREGPWSTSSWQSSSYSSAEPSHQWTSSGVVSAATSLTQSTSRLFLVGGFTASLLGSRPAAVCAGVMVGKCRAPAEPNHRPPWGWGLA